MKICGTSLIWASLIIAAAFVAHGQGLSDAASFGIVMGLTGAAIANIAVRRKRGLGSC